MASVLLCRGRPIAECPDGQPVECPKCLVSIAPGTPDPCLGQIDGADNVCCGHGVYDGWISLPALGVVFTLKMRDDYWMPEPPAYG